MSARPLGRQRRFGASLLAAMAGVLLSTAAQAGEKPRFPDLQLSGEVRGEAAVQALGAQLPGAAAHYRMSPEKLQNILRQDRHSRLDRRGRLFYIEPGASQNLPASGSVVAEAAPYDLAQTFLLASRPGSSRVLYLDFTGHSISGTAWNGGAAINAQAFDTDGNPGAFSAAELEAIQKIWQRVAEDYAPFDVNVTTADPGSAAIERTSSSDNNYGSRVVITRNDFYNCSCGGVAYVGTFDYYSSTTPGYYQPAWVFSNALGGSEKYIAEAASHEAGHNLGLSHDGRTSPSEGYYGGHGSGETGWAPIMGVGYYKNLSQWSRGEYSYASNTEDDLVIIAQNGALPLSDDAGNTTAAASSLGGSSSNGSVQVDRGGLIGSRTDADVYAFVASAGTVQFTVSPAALGPNLDISAELLDSSGAVIASANPADGLGASISASVGGGGYFLRVDGVGKGSPSTDYSDYGSLGEYRIVGSYADSGAAPPLAALTAMPTSGTAPLAVSFDAANSTDSDGSIVSYAWDFGNGNGATGLTASYTYTVAGTYTATLTVTDSDGLSDSESVVITVTAAQQQVSVKNVAVTAAAVKGGYQCTATVAIQNDSAAPVGSATVSGAWTGTITGSVSGTTNSAGNAVIRSAKTRKRGTCTYTVNSVAASAYVYVSPTPKPAGSVSY